MTRWVGLHEDLTQANVMVIPIEKILTLESTIT